ncbi:subunit Dph2 of diphthamide synthase [Hamiltosporidium tvaerminnensis]|uniref:2-(3-amino-3-carboxypropyl)histidine synthase subunit 1 n=2 Tax=Hamiltosporidium TaxID=1176354 RepID=A0A4Q9LF83_9MICR|nr:Diphthamide biosynthesis protein 1 [Hamiltosporidium tvaerminnensis]TBT98438.1 subunit Dph2 of diphthamide synthase [Hamiltosporidium tvaerminnensis]TBU05270.1 subunit Dph2 of diphthamide synthase [Hamiltosporidium magnivora]TBU06678.1 subunit Dph2 of diphthamide synthase [Hamiltosporidium magnivora]TBU12337.1 subunit Dph2 of diphthamide synthase [Hamiltosporidium tvaerminnensis]
MNKVQIFEFDELELLRYTRNLPQNYNFEIKKTLTTIKRNNSKQIGLQFPDGLLKYSLVLSDIITYFTGASTIILSDVVYGACCIDDISAHSLGCDLLIHYGHSCLIPITSMLIQTLYIFVDIRFNTNHCTEMVKTLIKNQKRITLTGTVQFLGCINEVYKKIKTDKNIQISRIRPLSPGEVLGCTSPKLKDTDIVVYIADGRFHLESVMISNPNLEFFKYCPFTRKMTQEYYGYEKFLEERKNSLKKALQGRTFGIILGTLGRQGNSVIHKNVSQKLKLLGYKIFNFLAPEISNNTLDSYIFIDAFVQISCPRLSIDWGMNFKKPLLTPFEILGNINEYTMDYYSSEGSAPWKNYNNTIS